MIYINGDSFTQRSNGLEDYSWPVHLAAKTNQPVINQAAGCGSNSRALSNLYDLHSLGIKPDLVIIPLTSFTRYHVPSSRFSAWNIGPTIINDRTGVVDKSIHKWWMVNVYDQIEFVRQYYNQIWQMHEFCNTHLQCPIMFFNGHNSSIQLIEQMLFGSDSEQQQWILKNVTNADDMYTEQYTTVFKFYREASKKWLRDMTSWLTFLNPDYIDPPNGEHPGHPSRHGHLLICDYVQCKIQETLPTLYQQWKLS